MKKSIQSYEPGGFVEPSGASLRSLMAKSMWSKFKGAFVWMALLAGLVFLLANPQSVRAHASPVGCTGSGLGIFLFTDSPDVHIGDTLTYSITVYNGANVGPVVCDATSIQAYVVTPDGISHPISLLRTNLSNGQSDYYPNVVSYVVRAQDVQPDGTVRSRATDTGVIHQNDTDSQGGGDQGVNTEVSLPCIAITAQCTGSVGENGAITFSGFVTNCGNNTLVNVTVTNFVNGGAFPVTFITNLLQGQSAPFSGSWVPLNPCSPSTATFVAQGVDQFTTHPRTVTSIATNTCGVVLTAGIGLSKNCPLVAPAPGQLLTFSGSITNTGNVTLTGIVVVNNQPAPNTTVFTAAALAPGAVTNFTGSYVAPASCNVSDTLIVTATSRCGVPVTNTATAVCPINTTPVIKVTQNCPLSPTLAGALLTYSGTVTNTGDIALTNVVVLNNASGSTPIYTTAILAPGAGASFTGSYIAPVTCSSASTATATGRSLCGVAVTNTASTVCAVITTPVLKVTETCPAISVAPGGLLTYSGTVTNTGNITLTNIVVLNDLSGSTPIYTTATLAPGAGAVFTGSYLAPTNCFSVSTSTATGTSICGVPVTNSAAATCAISTTPVIVVLQSCPVVSAVPGGLFTFSGSVSNAGNITVTNVVVLNSLIGSPVFTAATLAPGEMATYSASYLAPTNCTTTSTSTATARSVCGVAVTNAVVSTCAINTTPVLTMTQNCPAIPPAPGTLMTYSGTITNTGNITITNVVILNNLSGGVPIFTAVTLAPGVGSSFTGSYLTPTNCSSTSLSTATGRSTCGTAVTTSAGATCAIATTPVLAITQTCGAIPAVPGGLLTYNVTVTNTGNITITNVVVLNNLTGGTPIYTAISLAPGVGASFSGSYLAPTNCSSTSVSTVTGQSVCGILVTNTAATTCAINTAPALAVTQNCPLIPAIPGGVLTYSGTVTNTGNITLTNVVVLNNLSGGSPIFTTLTLAPGEGATFTASYLAPTNCSSASTSTATARSICGIAVTNSATSICNIATTPVLSITQNCPAIPTVPGALLTYSGTVTNTGNITVTNVVILNNLSGGTPIYTALTLAPGVGASFTGSYLTPTNCTTTSTSTVTGRSVCGIAVTNAASSTCAIITTPVISVTQTCPAIQTVPGGLLTYSGTVTNTGNITLTNVVVLNNLSGGTPVYTAISLAPGAGASFTGSYLTPTNCSTTSTSTATGQSVCGGNATNSVTVTCQITTVPQIVVTQACPLSPVIPGGLLTYSGSVSNAGNILLTNVVVLNNLSGGTPVFTTALLAPGAVTNFTGSYLAPTNCSTTSTSTATARSICGIGVTNTATTICAIVTVPVLSITQNCPAIPTVPGALLTYSGTVTNTGNITITNVVVLNNLSGGTPIYTAISLAPGVGASFTGSYLTPTNCTTTSTSTVTGQSVCGIAVTNSASSTCAIITTPVIKVTQTCPAIQAVPGGLLVYSGTVTNTGNITLTNVVVLNNLSGGTPIFTAISLAPGAGASFTGSYLAPTNCSSASTATATGQSVCGGSATNTASSICQITTTPQITIRQACPLIPAVPGGLFTYTGSVSNSGNIMLTNVVVLNNLSGSTPVFIAVALAPGVVTNFTGSYLTPTNCATTSTSIATGTSICGISVTNAATTTCQILTTPAIYVTQTCPSTPILAGGILSYSGTVSNGGNITLTNIIVMSDRPADNTVIFTLATLAPGATANFSGSYVVPFNCCIVWSTVSASGQGCSGVTVTDTATRTCTVFTAPAIVVTKVCTPGILRPGDLLTYSGSVSNSGTITLINVSVANNQSPGSPPLAGPINLAPGETATFTGSYIVQPDFCGSDIVTASGLDVCTYLPVSNSVTTTCPITTAPRITVMKSCPLLPTPRGGLYTYSGSVSNAGNVSLVNVYVVDNAPSNNTPVIGPITLAPGASARFTNSYVAPTCCCLIFDTLTARGQDHCSASNVTASFTAVCPLLTTPGIKVVEFCPASPIPLGSAYMFSGYVTNTGDAVLTNVVVYGPLGTNNPVLGPIQLAPHEAETYFGTFTAVFNTSAVTVTARGQDTCAGNVYTNTASCPVVTTPSITRANNAFNITFPTASGKTYTVQYKNHLLDPSWTDFQTVSGTGGNLTVIDPVPGQPTRFYRVKVTP